MAGEGIPPHEMGPEYLAQEMLTDMVDMVNLSNTNAPQGLVTRAFGDRFLFMRTGNNLTLQVKFPKSDGNPDFEISYKHVIRDENTEEEVFKKMMDTSETMPVDETDLPLIAQAHKDLTTLIKAETTNQPTES